MFGEPAATVETSIEIAYYARILSYMDSSNALVERDFDEWNSKTELIVPDCIPLLTTGNIVSGNHQYYPYDMITLRDARTGSILIFVSSPSNISVGIIDVMPDGQNISLRIDENNAVILLGGDSDGDLLSQIYLSIIDN